MNSTHKQIATTEEVTEKIRLIATQILEDYPNKTPLFVALLRGAAPFATKLMTELVKQKQDYHPEIDYMMVRTYGDKKHAGEPQIITDVAPGTIINGRDVVIIDDVLDKGVTADFVLNHMRENGANSVKLAVLCDKSTLREHSIAANYVGFTFSDNWLVGMGMDDPSAGDEGYRWLDEIWEITQN